MNAAFNNTLRVISRPLVLFTLSISYFGMIFILYGPTMGNRSTLAPYSILPRNSNWRNLSSQQVSLTIAVWANLDDEALTNPKQQRTHQIFITRKHTRAFFYRINFRFQRNNFAFEIL